ncbi:seizure protein 6-like [Hypomesus transpacificus]|uniref:seizure protein 6-like n=1 Tax=Hypomesus transpacificus TaxID=137520 RepID=UPI001F0728B6|nr:seizure protein 6-like [Hypomesus transpacificus]
MCMGRDYQLHVLVTVWVLAASVTRSYGQVSDPGGHAAGQKRVDSGAVVFTHSPTPDPEGEAQPFTTAPPLNVPGLHPGLHPGLRGLRLQQALLSKDFQGEQHFFSPTVPGSYSALEEGGPSTPGVPHEDAPAFSDIATTSTVAGTTPLTPPGPTAALALAQKKLSKDRGRGEERGASTTPVTKTAVATGNSHSATGPASEGEDVVETTATATVLTTSVAGAKADGRGVKNNTGVSRKLTPSGEGDEGSIVTSTITTMHTTGPCSVNFSDPEGYVEIPHHPGARVESGVHCTYVVTVYLGYGIEVQVLNASVSEGEQVTLEDMGGREPSILANQSVLTRGLVLRSWSNQINIHYRSQRPAKRGSLLLRYQVFELSCPLPKEPANGDVSVSHLHAGGEAYFQCVTGYQLQGAAVLSCRNATSPYWSGREPRCLASCGGMIKNATFGRIVSPGFPGNYSNNLTCHWVLEAPPDHRLHVHFEKVALAEDDDRLLIKNGNNIDSPPVYDSYEVEYLPNEGVVSSGRHLFVEFTTDGTVTSTGAAVRYEAFAKGTCYSPFVKYGNFSSSDPGFGVGAVVEFACDPGYTLEQGSIIIECVDVQNPQWNETEPACRAVCSGEMTDSAGVVLSPNWPEAYDRGQDCIWGVHVEEDKRILLDIQVLHVGKNDLLTFYDGDDLTANILGQYSGSRPRFRLYTSMADVTIQFQSDPATNIYGYNNGFVLHFFEVPRNDTCSELPEITSGWKSTSHPDLVHGTVVTYQCYPGYQLSGAEILICQWDLTWSGDVPSCEKVISCPDPGVVEHSRRVVPPRLLVGSTVQYVCNKGYVLSGSGLLTCYNRDTAIPKWSERPPKCVPERYEPCRNPGAPSTGIQSPEQAFYQAGESLSFSCRPGYQLQGEASIRCVPGHPSQWSAAPPACRASSTKYVTERRLDVTSGDNGAGGSSIVMAVLTPAAVVCVVALGVYLYLAKQGKSLRMPSSSLPPYDNMTEESDFNNPVYETVVSTDVMHLQDVDSYNTIVLS